MSDSNLSIFGFKGAQVRVAVVDGQPWWVAVDVCESLDIRNSRQALTRIPEKYKGVISNDTPGGTQEMAVVSEPGLYELIFASRKKEAKEFRRFVFDEVLPEIRKTGSYNARPVEEPHSQPALPAPTIAEQAKMMADAFDVFQLKDSPRHLQLAKDYIANLMTQDALPAASPKWLGVTEIAEAMGYPANAVVKHRSGLGRVVAAWYRDAEGADPHCEERLVNGRTCSLKVYQRTEELDTMISAYLEAKGA